MAGFKAKRRGAYADKSQPRRQEWKKHPTGVCGTPGCGRKHFTHDLCNRCWLRRRRAMEMLAGRVDHGPAPRPEELEKGETWRPTFERLHPIRNKRLRRIADEVVKGTEQRWSATAENRVNGIIARRRMALSQIVHTMRALPFQITSDGPQTVAISNNYREMGVDRPMWDALVKSGWIHVEPGRDGVGLPTCNITERGKALIIDFDRPPTKEE